MHGRLVAQHDAVERGVPRLAPVIQFLAQPLGDLGMDLVGADRRIETLADRENQLELVDVGFQRRGHVGILQLAGGVPAVGQGRAMNLTERSGKRGLLVEAAELALPIWPQLARHAPAHEGPAHGRCVGLELGELAGIFRRQRVGNRGQKLRRLHQRPLQPAQRTLEVGRVLAAIERQTKIALARQLGGQAADGSTDASIAAEPSAETVAFVVCHA